MRNNTPDPYEYAQEILSRYLDHFLRERKDVCRQKGIEPLHRMRVASRRLRAALRVFREILPSGKVKKWRHQVRLIGRLLGQARQLDIQIRFLEKTRGAEARAMVRLLRKDRTVIQKQIVHELAEHRMKRRFCGLKRGIEDLHENHNKSAIAEFNKNRRRLIIKRVNTIRSFRQYVNRPECVRELHLLRIAAKNLRYTLEILLPWYGVKVDRLIRASRDIQDVLGDLHELDVLLEFLSAAERSHTAVYLEGKYTALRERTYRDFVRLWDLTPLAKATPPKITALSPN